MSGKRPTRRGIVRSIGVGTGVALAGCLGGGGGGGDGGDGGNTTTTGTSVDPAQLSATEWREYASEQAKGEGTLKLNFTNKNDNWVQLVADANFHGEYAPLKDSVSYVQTGSDKQATLYQQQRAAGNVTMGVMDSAQLINIINQGLELMDLSNVPSFKQADDAVKSPPYLGAYIIKLYGHIHNTEGISDPPQSWEDFLAPRFEGKTMIVDFTPTPKPAAILMQVTPDGYIEDVKNHYNIQFVKIMPNGTRMVADGRGDVMFNAAYDVWAVDKAQGYNTAFIDVPELTYLLPGRIAVAKGTPTPWKAKLFIDWIMGPGQRAPVNGEEGTITIDRSYSNPGEMSSLTSVQEGKVWPREDIEMDPAAAPDEYASRFGYQG